MDSNRLDIREDDQNYTLYFQIQEQDVKELKKRWKVGLGIGQAGLQGPTA
jgi:hypothetical protein